MSNPPNGSGFFSGSVVLPEVNSTDALVADLTATVAEVTASATAAQASAVTAATAASNALISETNVANLAQQATTTVNAATSAAAQAQAAITAANTTLTTAQAAATTATTQAGNAATSATAAAASQASATASQTAATASQSAAAGSASTASTAATTATNQATAAGQSATNAAASASAASTSASSASSSQSAASTSAANASAAATGAGNSSVAAANSATNAATSATTATNQAAAAAASAALAAQNAAAVALPIPVSSGGTGGTSIASAIAGLGLGGVTGKNRIINGNCVVQQRPTVTVSGSTVYGGPDRFVANCSASAGSFTQSAVGAAGSDGMARFFVRQTVVTTPPALTSGLYWGGIKQAIEGYNCYDLKGQAVAVSFQFAASVNGTYSVALYTGDTLYSSVTTFNYTGAPAVAAVQVEFPVIPVGYAYPNNSSALGLGLVVGFLNAGTYATANLNVWQSGLFETATGSTNWATTVGNYIQASDVQLEPGTNCTPFEHESYAVTLAKCQRYFQFVYPSIGAYSGAGGGNFMAPVFFNTAMRTNPSAALAANGNFSNCATNYVQVNNAMAYWQITVTAAGNAYAVSYTYTLSAEF